MIININTIIAICCIFLRPYICEFILFFAYFCISSDIAERSEKSCKADIMQCIRFGHLVLLVIIYAIILAMVGQSANVMLQMGYPLLVVWWLSGFFFPNCHYIGDPQ